MPTAVRFRGEGEARGAHDCGAKPEGSEDLESGLDTRAGLDPSPGKHWTGCKEAASNE